MARVRRVEISNFRCIRSFVWDPSPGINCLIGPGDSGKSTILDALDLCLGARRAFQFTDADFHNLNVDEPITITLTIGALDEALKNINTYGLFLRGLNPATGEIEDEPEKDLETVLCLQLTVASDLEPVWRLFSDRAKAQDTKQNLIWKDRVALAPTRIGVLAESNLGWRRGSVLNRLTDEKADASAALAKAARDARTAFGTDAEKQLGETLNLVGEAATELGIDIGGKARALLDAHTVTFGGGTISLHDADGVPLRGLGIGSTRLLIAGLQRRAAKSSSMLLVDELEHGLEPHRIIRFLGSLGAKETPPPLQVFVTTHSPVALRELSGAQLFVVRETEAGHTATCVGTDDDLQGTIRLYPEAFLAKSVMVCEGASEVGLVRGLDHYFTAQKEQSISACGVAMVDGRGVTKLLKLAKAFMSLGYRVAILRDNDVQPDAAEEVMFTRAGGMVLMWQENHALEDELFASLPARAVGLMVEKAVTLHGDALVNAHLQSKSEHAYDLERVRSEIASGAVPDDMRTILGKASRTKETPWFKNVSAMEDVACDIVGPQLAQADKGFRTIVEKAFTWARDD
ncbi:ATP-dependent nuclease [Novispirillum itersonii]|uniref:ATP-dependent nuclease n=1 Tax=Novispirillum itersonii TaxID=189 RepID=UPI0003612E6F|nr:ATP-binding protein [Novispirillum itersonii]